MGSSLRRGELLAGSASGWASHGDPAALATLETDPHRWRQFLEQETRACTEPGTPDGGTHILFAATPPDNGSGCHEEREDLCETLYGAPCSKGA
jgi:hypothetical protein